jgi:hypothetical protein
LPWSIVATCADHREANEGGNGSSVALEISHEAAKAGQTLTAEQHRVLLAAKLDMQKQLDLSEDR